MANVSFAKWVLMKGRQANAIIHRKRLRGEFPWLERPGFVWEVEFDIRDITGAGATSQNIDLDATYPNNPFIDEVWLEPGAQIVPLEAFAGGVISDFTLEMGDAGNRDGLVEASVVFTGVTLGAPLYTPAAAEYALRREAGFLPTLTARSTGANISSATTGRALLRIPFTPWRAA